MSYVAHWQSAGSLSQRPWVQLLVAPPFFRARCLFKGPQMATAQIVSFITHDQSSDHRGVWSIGLLPAVICSNITHIDNHTQRITACIRCSFILPYKYQGSDTCLWFTIQDAEVKMSATCRNIFPHVADSYTPASYNMHT